MRRGKRVLFFVVFWDVFFIVCWVFLRRIVIMVLVGVIRVKGLELNLCSCWKVFVFG